MAVLALVLSTRNMDPEVATIRGLHNQLVEVCVMLRESQRILTRQDKLAVFFSLTGDEFIVECDALIREIYKGLISGIYLLGRSLALLAFFDKEKIYWMPQAAISLAKRQIVDTYKSITDKSILYQARDAFRQGCGSFMQFYETAIGKDICDFVNDEFAKIEAALPSKMEIALNNLSNANVSALKNLSGESTPDHQCAYNMTSVFKNIDPQVFSERVSGLSNASLRELSEFISVHYLFGCSLGPGCNRYNDDLPFLLVLKKILTPKFASRKGVDRYVSNQFLKYLDGAIKRSQGDNGGIMC